MRTSRRKIWGITWIFRAANVVYGREQNREETHKLHSPFIVTLQWKTSCWGSQSAHGLSGAFVQFNGINKDGWHFFFFPIKENYPWYEDCHLTLGMLCEPVSTAGFSCRSHRNGITLPIKKEDVCVIRPPQNEQRSSLAKNVRCCNQPPGGRLRCFGFIF